MILGVPVVSACLGAALFAMFVGIIVSIAAATCFILLISYAIKKIKEMSRINKLNEHKQKIIKIIEKTKGLSKENIDLICEKCQDYNELVKNPRGIADETLMISLEDLSEEGIKEFGKNVLENIEKINQRIQDITGRKIDAKSKIQRLEKAKAYLSDIMRHIPSARIEIERAEYGVIDDIETKKMGDIEEQTGEISQRKCGILQQTNRLNTNPIEPSIS